ncbi:MAG: hypothetical protein HFE78_08315 [Clostridiales bacterium]|nr:hypothetical protein [Clostridiales bacterium]
MEKNENEELARLEEEIKNLPGRAQQAICWIIENIEFVMDMCKECDMTDEKMEEYERMAAEKEDYMALFLLCIAKKCKNKDF